MLEGPQIIDLIYKGKRHFFYAYRYATDKELIDAMHQDKITDSAAYEKGILAYTDCYKKGDECGRMYLLDKSISTFAHEAAHMASCILARSGNTAFELTTDKAAWLEEDFCQLIGTITSELYSKSRYF